MYGNFECAHNTMTPGWGNTMTESPGDLPGDTNQLSAEVNVKCVPTIATKPMCLDQKQRDLIFASMKLGGKSSSGCGAFWMQSTFWSIFFHHFLNLLKSCSFFKHQWRTFLLPKNTSFLLSNLFTFQGDIFGNEVEAGQARMRNNCSRPGTFLDSWGATGWAVGLIGWAERLWQQHR